MDLPPRAIFEYWNIESILAIVIKLGHAMKIDDQTRLLDRGHCICVCGNGPN